MYVQIITRGRVVTDNYENYSSFYLKINVCNDHSTYDVCNEMGSVEIDVVFK